MFVLLGLVIFVTLFGVCGLACGLLCCIHFGRLLLGGLISSALCAFCLLCIWSFNFVAVGLFVFIAFTDFGVDCLGCL